MKNLALALSALVLASACSVSDIDANPASFGDVSAKTSGQADTPVQLFRSSSYIHTKYGQSQLGLTWEVRVKNLAYNKSVVIRQQLKSGQWTNINLSYNRNADNGFEIWTGSVSELNGFTMSNQFAVSYTVNGATYWDNNGGANYNMPYNCGEMLGKGYQVAQKSASFYNNTLTLTADVRNIGYTKTVKVIYTLNNWATSASVNLSFQSSYSYGYAYVTCPTAAGFERWASWSAPVGNIAGAKYYIEYTVNGVKYYDNNWGFNYTL